MVFEKGRKKTGGRKAGTPNKTTKEYRETVQHLLELLEPTQEDFEQLEPAKRIDIYLKLLEYVCPKFVKEKRQRTLEEMTDIF